MHSLADIKSLEAFFSTRSDAEQVEIKIGGTSWIYTKAYAMERIRLLKINSGKHGGGWYKELCEVRDFLSNLES